MFVQSLAFSLKDVFEQTGQYEPVTTRIRNILREYKDGVGIFKELIQNADDAGASKVKFLVDWRQGRTVSLFSPGMAECQGPALWAYNDALFTDEDLENINKLAGETKVEDISKIGRFGLGFNAVYHLTDVPSFISREHLVVFDPNTHHLQRHIKDRSRPGIHINLVKQPESLRRYQDQFQPYNGVFGFSTKQRRGEFYYDGTLFRFPFRTTAQASTSDIIKTPYGRDKIQAIVSSICECASDLLIFSQHVKEVDVYELKRSNTLDEMRLVLSVKKPNVCVLSQEGMNSREPFIKQCSKWWGKYRESQKSCSEFPSSCELVNIVTTKEKSELSRCDRRFASDQTWIVVSASGNNVSTSLKIARSREGRARGFLPCGGAAFVVQKTSEQVEDSDLSGQLFCFLPLSIPTGLPVHVNGYFAIMFNRVEIWKRSSLRNQPIEVEWNEALMEDALARAYIMLLENMKDLIGDIQNYKFHSLWPRIDTVDMKSWEKLVQKICMVLLDPKTKLFYSDGNWISINDGLILSDDFTTIHMTAMKVLTSLGIHVFNLPREIFKTLAKFNQQGILQQRTLSFTQFLQTYFLPNIKTFPSSRRDAVVCFGLDRIMKEDEETYFNRAQEIELFKRNACISVSQKEEIFSKPSQLIHPSSSASELFSEQDHRFPVGNGLRTANRLYVLETLGMVKDLDWAGIYERAQSVAKFRDIEQCRKLITYIKKQIDQLSVSDIHRSCLQDIQDVEFLPVLTKPVEGYLLPWKGSAMSFPSPRFCSARNVFLPGDAKLVGSSCLIVNTSNESGCGKMNAQMRNLLGFSSRRPEDKFVIQQLDEAIKFWSRLTEKRKKETGVRFAIESICQKIYKFFNFKIVESSLHKLTKRNWLFLHGKFVESKKVAYTSNGNGAPFLFTLPANYRRDFRNLFEAMQIKETFDDEDYIGALYELEDTKHGNALSGDELQTAIFFISQIDVENPAVMNYIGNIPLPDTESFLRRSGDVVVNLCLWLQDPDDNIKVHEKVPPQTAHALGAKSLKNLILKEYSHCIRYGESFEQHEDLTDRLKGILDGYPADGILKELVQNADDAQASEVHFVHDTRSLECERMVTKEETSAEIHGPALCVYNDRPFKKKDLDGIRNLGKGSKRDTSGMTGKYGIGFNSVYHLTDCPSFLSNDDTLVFLDPHSRYFVDDVRGQIFESMDARFRDIYSGTLDRYLADHFKLQGSTMFRFPLRKKRNESKISHESPDMENLLQIFQKEARQSLLFLNHVKKITLSKIRNDKLKEIYRVESIIAPDDEVKRQELARRIIDQHDCPTEEIGWKGISYNLIIEENKQRVEKWLVQKCIGSDTRASRTYGREQEKIPDGSALGLFPHGGLAVPIWTRSSSYDKDEDESSSDDEETLSSNMEVSSSESSTDMEESSSNEKESLSVKKEVSLHRNNRVLRGIVYCFLPLPENYTGLPVHVNGHFTLDSTRRGLWTDTDGKGEKCKWNHFMKSCVLAPAYAALIREARNHLCGDRNDSELSRYHDLFPSVLESTPWKTFIIELYYYLGNTRAKVLPLLVPTESEKNASCKKRSKKVYASDEVDPGKFACTRWLSGDEGYFKNFDMKDSFLYLLMRIGLPVLLHAPNRIYDGLASAGISSNRISPESVIGFIREFQSKGSTCWIGNLPKKLEATKISTIPELSALIEYCCGDNDFGKYISGLPLLLTQDGYLRVFQSSQPVYLSKFGDLFPTQSHQFVHYKIVRQIRRSTTRTEGDIVRNFTVQDLARLLPNVFTNKALRAIKDVETWKFSANGTLSERWFKRLWEFLQNHTNPENGNESSSLNCLSEWPVIPTTDEKLVTIENAKSILDMTLLGNESAQQKNVRTFLRELGCPELNKKITIPEKKSSNTRIVVAVTDPYVAHPYNVEDVLIVLHRMLRAKELDISKVYEEDIRDFLRFVQDDYERLGNLEDCKKMIKELPFHKALNGRFVSLLGNYSSYVLVPSGVPITQQLKELQNQAKCLFLSSDALLTLKKLYTNLGVKGGQNVTQFYVEYVFRHFEIFSRESQMEHLQYIKNIVFPSFPQGGSLDKDKLLKKMKETSCIPDRNGRLHVAADFFDPKNDLFKAMFIDDHKKFPPPPFNDASWLTLLREIGLQSEVTPQLFLRFCTTVAENGRRCPNSSKSRVQSEKLVKCLFSRSRSGLRKKRFLSEISQIKFIASAKVEDELTLIHEQYECPQNIYPPFIEFRDAVPWDFRFISWSTVPILPKWAEENDMAELRSLGIASSGPAYTKVLDHLENVVNSPSLNSVDEELLKKITESIYQFLSDALRCFGRDPDDKCSEVCVDIGNRLRGSSCIFLPEDKTFVSAEQLVLKPPEKFPFKPFLFPVPAELGELHHFLKRLGATDRPTPFQIAFVLQSIHDQVGENFLSPDQMKEVSYAMRMIFYLLHKHKDANRIDELYLPSQSQQLLKSCEMVCKVSPRFTEVIKNLQLPILFRFDKCGLTKTADVYIDALPKHLAPIKFDDIVREEIAPECESSTCSEARRGAVCSFQEQFQNLLRSDEFQKGLKRLIVHNQQNPQEYEEIIKRLQTNVAVTCIGLKRIKVHVILRSTSEVLDNLEKSCYAVQKDGKWLLYMQHNLKDDAGKVATATCINKILGNCIQKENGLTAMLNCSSASEIAVALNNLDITHSTSRGAEDFTESEDEMFFDSESDGEHGNRGDEGGLSGTEQAGIGGTSTRRGKKRAAQSHGGYSIGHSGGYGGGEYTSIRDDAEDEKMFPKNSREAMRWLQQSRSDLGSARWLLQSGPPYNAHSCFQSHQVVEKCLKAMLFHHCGISSGLLGSHDVVGLADKLKEETGLMDETVLQSVRRFSNFYLNTRYPNRQPLDIVPCEAFSDDEAKMAVDGASKLFDFADNELNASA